MVGGAFFQTRVRTPRMSRSSISNGEPGRVSSEGLRERHGGEFIGHAPRSFFASPLAGKVARENAPVGGRVDVLGASLPPPPRCAWSPPPPPPTGGGGGVLFA